VTPEGNYLDETPWLADKVILLHDSAFPHTNGITTQLLEQFCWECVSIHHTVQTLHLTTFIPWDHWRKISKKNTWCDNEVKTEVYWRVQTLSPDFCCAGIKEEHVGKFIYDIFHIYLASYIWMIHRKTIITTSSSFMPGVFKLLKIRGHIPPSYHRVMNEDNLLKLYCSFFKMLLTYRFTHYSVFLFYQISHQWDIWHCFCLLNPAFCDRSAVTRFRVATNFYKKLYFHTLYKKSSISSFVKRINNIYTHKPVHHQ
jgi:hypothetical protein